MSPFKLEKFDAHHCEILENYLMNLLNSNKKDMLHLIYYSLLCIRNATEKRKIFTHPKCMFCSSPPSSEERMLTCISNFKQEMAFLLNCFFEAPLNLTYDFFRFLKLGTNTRSGMYPFDVCQVFFNEKKVMDMCVSNSNRFYGILFKCHDRNKKNHDTFAYTIIQDRILKKSDCAMLIYSTGTPIEPEHFCSYFIDHKTAVVYFYNSLANKKQFESASGFTARLSHAAQLSGIPEIKYTTITNTHRQQRDNKLCGMFATSFLMSMYACESCDREQYFKHFFDQNIDMDEKMYEVQEEFVNANNTNNYLLTNCALFTSFKDLFS